MIVGDGMGGHDCGKLASETAVRAFSASFKQSQGSVCSRLRSALDAANLEVGQQFARRSLYGGTTLLAAYVGAGVLWWVSVGDSLLMLWRRGRLLRLNADHSMRSLYSEMAKNGAMDMVEALSHGHSLRSAVTGEAMQLVDAPPTPYPLLPGDRIVLASDGADALLLPVPMSPTLRAIMENPECDNLSVSIVEACKQMDNPYADNVTVLSTVWSR